MEADVNLSGRVKDDGVTNITDNLQLKEYTYRVSRCLYLHDPYHHVRPVTAWKLR